MSRQLIEENMRRIEQIKSSFIPYSQKEVEMREINANFIESYCNRKGGFITLPKSGVTKTYSFLKYKLTKDEFIGFALDNLVFHRNKEIFTYWELIDICLVKKLIKEKEDWKQYSRDDLQTLIDRSNTKNGKFITGKSLFLDLVYLYACSICNSNLRNLCIIRGLISHEKFGTRPRESEYYENKLGWIPIMKEVQVIMEIWAIYHHRYEEDENFSYFDCLGVRKFPTNIRECEEMQKNGHVENYNRVARNCYKEVMDNIVNIVTTINNYEYSYRCKIRIYTIFLRKMSPGSLEELDYGQFDNIRLLRLKVNEALRNLNLI